MSLAVIVQDESPSRYTPSVEQFQFWIDKTLSYVANAPAQGEITIRIVDEEESAVLNQTFRHKAGPTNVLSFSYDSPTDQFTGDLAICAPLVERQAREQAKLVIAHWAHLIIHGTLHLLGYDHIDEADAHIMESTETKIMLALQFENPYE